MKIKRSIYRVIPIVETELLGAGHIKVRRRKLIGWHVKGPGGYTSSFLHVDGNYKRHAITLAVSLAKENKPSQVIIHAKDHITHKYEIALEFSYGVDSKAKG